MNEILTAARSEALRTLARNSVACIAYDAIADMAVKAARLICPKLDECPVLELPEEFKQPDAVVGKNYRQVSEIVMVADLVDDLWTEYRIRQVAERMWILLGRKNVLRGTFRGELARDLKTNEYVLTISALAEM